MLASLETRYLKAEKWLPLPTIILGPKQPDAGGYYYHPFNGELAVGERFFDGASGTIIVNGDACGEFQSIIAHEFRHHWQWCRGWKYDGVGFEMSFNPIDYKSRVVRYFTRSHSELDALRYEAKHSPDDTNLERLEWVRAAA